MKVSSDKKVIAKKPLTNLYEMNSSWGATMSVLNEAPSLPLDYLIACLSFKDIIALIVWVQNSIWKYKFILHDMFVVY